MDNLLTQPEEPRNSNEFGFKVDQDVMATVEIIDSEKGTVIKQHTRGTTIASSDPNDGAVLVKFTTGELVFVHANHIRQVGKVDDEEKNLSTSPSDEPTITTFTEPGNSHPTVVTEFPGGGVSVHHNKGFLFDKFREIAEQADKESDAALVDDDDDTLPLVPLNRDIILQSKHAGSVLSALISLIIELPLIESVKDDPNLDAVVVRFLAPLSEEQIDNIGAVLNVVLTSEYMVAVEAPDVPMPEALRPLPDPKDVQIDALRAELDLTHGTIDDLNLKVADLRTANAINDGTINFLRDELAMMQSMNETRKLLKPMVEAVRDPNIDDGKYAERINDGWQVAAQWGDGASLNVMWVREVKHTPTEKVAAAATPSSAFEQLLIANEIGIPVEIAHQKNSNGQSWLGLRYLNQVGR